MVNGLPVKCTLYSILTKKNEKKDQQELGKKKNETFERERGIEK